MIQKIAQQSGFNEEYIKEQGEYSVGGWFTSALSARTNGLTNQDLLWTVQQKIIIELAEQENCIIVGRCADFILRNRADCLKVFIHSSIEKRAERIVKEYGQREKSPVQRLKDKDKQRAAYYRFYTDMKWGQAQHYHISLDSGEVGIDKCVELIAKLY